jgi:hypothetical protein
MFEHTFPFDDRPTGEVVLYARSMPAQFSLDKIITFRLKVVYRVNGYTPSGTNWSTADIPYQPDGLLPLGGLARDPQGAGTV